MLNDRSKQKILDMAQTHNVAVKSVKTGLTHFQTQVARRAAAQRGLSLSSYLRRSVMAMAAHDLGMSWDDVMVDEPPVGPYGGNSREAEPDPRGRGFGSWRITGLS